jgi:hypothetical protein
MPPGGAQGALKPAGANFPQKRTIPPKGQRHTRAQKYAIGRPHAAAEIQIANDGPAAQRARAGTLACAAT